MDWKVLRIKLAMLSKVKYTKYKQEFGRDVVKVKELQSLGNLVSTTFHRTLSLVSIAMKMNRPGQTRKRD
jgi:hypothetical protein